MIEQKFRLLNDSPYVAPSEAHPDPWKLVDEYRQAAKLAKVRLPFSQLLFVGSLLTVLCGRLLGSMASRYTLQMATCKLNSWTSTATSAPTSGEVISKVEPSSSRRHSRLSSRRSLLVELESRSILAEVSLNFHSMEWNGI